MEPLERDKVCSGHHVAISGQHLHAYKQTHKWVVVGPNRWHNTKRVYFGVIILNYFGQKYALSTNLIGILSAEVRVEPVIAE